MKGGAPEAGAPEAGAPEAGAPEAGAPEAGAPEAGTAKPGNDADAPSPVAAIEGAAAPGGVDASAAAVVVGASSVTECRCAPS